MNLGAWIQSNWWWIVLLWPIVSAVASLLYGIADKSPRWHAFFSLLAAAGIDIPKILDAINRWINKDPPKLGGGTHSPPLKFPSRRKPPPPPPMAGRVGFGYGVISATGILLCGFAVKEGISFSCAPMGPPPPVVVADFAEVVNCVIANDSTWESLVAKCSGYTLAEIEAAIQWLLADGKFAKEHPEAIEPLRTELSAVRLKLRKQEGVQ